VGSTEAHVNIVFIVDVSISQQLLIVIYTIKSPSSPLHITDFSEMRRTLVRRDSAQWSRCQLGCSCSQNFPCKLGSCYRSILSEIRV